MWHVLRGQHFLACTSVTVGLLVFAVASRGEERSASTLHAIPLRGGLRAALGIAGDRAGEDRGQFLVEMIRRVYDANLTASKTQREQLLQTLLAHLDRHAGLPGAADTLPLPLAPETWKKTVFAGADVPDLVTAILRSREAALMYYGLLSLDDDTRGWFDGHPELLAEIASRHAPAFMVAARGLRIRDNAVHAPGGADAGAAWRGLTGHPTTAPVDFVRGLLTVSEGRLAYFYDAMAQLQPAQQRFLLGLDAPDSGRTGTARRLLSVFERLADAWVVAERPFWRPTLDPALLVADLTTDEAGRPVLPGTRAFWTTVFADTVDFGGEPVDAAAARQLATGEPVDLTWLCEQIFRGGQVSQRKPYDMVLFASRVIGRVTEANAAAAVEAVRAAGAVPAVVTTIERAGVTDVSVYNATVRRARLLAAIGDHSRATRTLAQFQGSLVVLTRGGLRRAVDVATLSRLITSLAAVDVNERGEYEGRLVRWWRETLDGTASRPAGASGAPAERAAGGLDGELITFVSGGTPETPVHVDWEGTRYRLDLAAAESTRIRRLLGDQPRPYLAAAAWLVRTADALTATPIDVAGIQSLMLQGDDAVAAVALPDVDKAVASLKRAIAQKSDSQRLAASAAALRGIADELFARGLTELVYATALGQPDRSLIVARDAAERHNFGLRVFGQSGPWRSPVSGADRARDWHVTGSLLGLDVRLADRALAAISARPPQLRPTLNDADRRVLIEVVTLMQPAALADEDRDVIVAALRRGRQRLEAAQTAAALTALADEIHLTGVRRSLIGWVGAHDRERLATFLSPSEYLWLGLGTAVTSRMHAWGAAAEPRLGCLCLRLVDRRPIDAFAGRPDSGLFASAFSDLNLRLAELLAELQMPAPLLPYVLSAATNDLINTAVSRGPDDRRGLLEFVHALALERVEQYLSLLTTDGPLVAVGEVTDSLAGSIRKTETPR